MFSDILVWQFPWLINFLFPRCNINSTEIFHISQKRLRTVNSCPENSLKILWGVLKIVSSSQSFRSKCYYRYQMKRLSYGPGQPLLGFPTWAPALSEHMDSCPPAGSPPCPGRDLMNRTTLPWVVCRYWFPTWAPALSEHTDSCLPAGSLPCLGRDPLALTIPLGVGAETPICVGHSFLFCLSHYLERKRRKKPQKF